MIAVIHADQAIDPILKVNLLQQVLEIGIQGSYCLEKAFGQPGMGQADKKIDAFTNWLNPASLSERDAAATKLKDFPDVRVPIANGKSGPQNRTPFRSSVGLDGCTAKRGPGNVC